MAKRNNIPVPGQSWLRGQFPRSLEGTEPAWCSAGVFTWLFSISSAVLLHFPAVLLPFSSVPLPSSSAVLLNSLPVSVSSWPPAVSKAREWSCADYGWKPRAEGKGVNRFSNRGATQKPGFKWCLKAAGHFVGGTSFPAWHPPRKQGAARGVRPQFFC